MTDIPGQARHVPTHNSTPGVPPQPTGRTLSLAVLLTRAVVGARGQQIGRLDDVIVRLRGEDYPLVTGLVANIGGRPVFLPGTSIIDWHSDTIQLSSAKVDLRAFERRPGEVLLSADILGHRLIDIPAVQLVRAYDLRLTETDAGWVLTSVDTRPRHWWHRTWQRLTGTAPDEAAAVRDWKAFEALIGHQPSALLRSPIARLRRMKPQQIADLLEDASHDEQSELLQQVHTDPELEADVFEELDDDRQSRLLRDRTDAEVAAVLARMRADDAADAVMDLPQDRRQPIVDLLPAGQRVKVTTLLGYQHNTAGGMMALDHLALHTDTPVAAVLEQVRRADSMQPEALTTIYAVDDQQRLRGAASLVALVQANPTVTLGAVAEPDPVRVSPPADLITVAMLMSDYNLLTLPVVDEDDQILGVVTVDDTLDATVPDNWRHREPAAQPERANQESGPSPAIDGPGGGLSNRPEASGRS
ncbi:magnesium transporter MgtE N-terminal domain-containing protein [Gandjariella thermophila]|nr:CBS domain-containing protein [Gandjariella thermophila]